MRTTNGILFELLYEKDENKREKLIHEAMVSNSKFNDLNYVISKAKESWYNENIILRFNDFDEDSKGKNSKLPNKKELKANYGYRDGIPVFKIALDKVQMSKEMFYRFYGFEFNNPRAERDALKMVEDFRYRESASKLLLSNIYKYGGF